MRRRELAAIELNLVLFLTVQEPISESLRGLAPTSPAAITELLISRMKRKN